MSSTGGAATSAPPTTGASGTSDPSEPTAPTHASSAPPAVQPTSPSSVSASAHSATSIPPTGGGATTSPPNTQPTTAPQPTTSRPDNTPTTSPDNGGGGNNNPTTNPGNGGGGGGSSSTAVGDGGDGGATTTPADASQTVFTMSTPSSVVQFSTNIVSTGAGGQVTTVFFTSTALVLGTPVSVSNQNHGGSSNSNTATIVGAVVGGVGGLLVLGLFLFFILRWKRRHDDDFDGNFDPDRVVRHSGHIDLAHDDAAAAAAAAQVTPYAYAPDHGNTGGHPDMGQPQMAFSDASSGQALLAGAAAGAGAAGVAYGRQTPGTYSMYAPTTSAGSEPADARSDSSAYPASTIPSNMGSYYYQNVPPGAGGAVSPRPTSPPSSSSGATESWVQPRTLKEREAFARMQVANTGEVVQHTDGGRIPEDPAEQPGPSEVPPSYDSIPTGQP